jgi:hypothetical protein
MTRKTEISRIKERYPAHSINMVYDHDGGYWAVAVSQKYEHLVFSVVVFWWR